MVAFQKHDVTQHEGEVFVVHREELIGVSEHSAAVYGGLFDVGVRMEQQKVLLGVKDINGVLGDLGHHFCINSEILFSLGVLAVHKAHIC